jgi:outer membrane protein assembly factor BamB
MSSSRTQLRKLEAASLAASSFLAIATYLLVSTSMAHEANPLVSALIGEVPWFVLAGGKLFAVVGAFAVYESVDALELDSHGLESSQIALAGASVTTLLLFANVLNDARVLVLSAPDSFYAGEFLIFAVSTGLFATILFGRVTMLRIAKRAQRRGQHRRTVVAVAMTVLVMLATPAAAVQMDSSGSQNLSVAPGDQLWSAGFSDVVLSSPTVADGTAFVQSGGELHAVDAQTGNLEWSTPTGGTSSVTSSPTVANGTVYVGSADNSLYAVDADTGSVEWNVSTGDTITSSPTVADGTVYIGSWDNSMYAFDATNGSEQWSTATQDRVLASPSVVNNTVYVSSYDGGLYAMDADTGTVDWNSSVGGYTDSSPTVANGTVYVGSSSDSLYAFDAVTGSQEWTASTGNNVMSSPTVADGTVYVGSDDGSLYAFDATTGSQEWSSPTGAGIGTSSPTVASGTVYVGSEDSSLYAFDAVTGSQEWSAATGNTIESSPTVANGTVYVGSRDNKLYAFDTGHSEDASGSRNKLHTLGHVGPVGAASKSGVSVSGVVTDQSGNPVSNATVKVVGVDYSQISADQSESLRDRANELLADAEKVRPPSWDSGKRLVDGGVLSQTSDKYPAVYDDALESAGLTGVEAFGQTTDPPSLSNPQLQVDANEKLLLTGWDPTSNALVQDRWDRGMPGTSTGGTIVIEQLGAGGEVTNVERVALNQNYDMPALSGAASHPFAITELGPGFYRVSMKESEFSYTIVAGDPQAIVSSIESDLRDRADSLTERAKTIRDNFQQNKFTKATVTTNATGHFSVNVGSTVNVTSVQAYKVPSGLDPTATSISDIRALYNAQSVVNVTDESTGESTLDISYSTPPSVVANVTSTFDKTEPVSDWYLGDMKRVQPPDGNVTLTVERISAPAYANSSTVSNVSSLLEDRLDELLTAEEARSLFQSYMEDLENGGGSPTVTVPSQVDIEPIRNDLKNVTEQNDALNERVQELTELIQSQNNSLNDTKAELLAMQQAFAELSNKTDTLAQTSSGNATGDVTTDGVADSVLCRLGDESACPSDDQTGVADGRWEQTEQWANAWTPPETLPRDGPPINDSMNLLHTVEDTRRSGEFKVVLATEDGFNTIGSFSVQNLPEGTNSVDFQLNSPPTEINVSKGKYDLYTLVDENGTLKRLNKDPIEVTVSVQDTGASLVIGDSGESVSPEEMQAAINESISVDSIADSVADQIGSSGANSTFNKNQTTVVVERRLTNGTRVSTVLEDANYTIAESGGHTVLRFDNIPFETDRTGGSDGSSDVNVTEIVYEVMAANEDRVVQETVTVSNPAAGQGSLEIKSVDASSLRPTPDSNWEATIQYSSAQGFEIGNATVYGPTGQALPAGEVSVVENNTVRMSPSREGVHAVELEFVDGNGNSEYRTVTVNAQSQSYGRNPTLRAADIGGDQSTAIAGNGLSGGEIKIEEQNQRIIVAVVLAPEQSASAVTIDARELPDATEQDVVIRVLRETATGTEQVQRSVTVKVTDSRIPDGATVYRTAQQSTSPIKTGLQGGEVTRQTAKTTILTYTGQDGEVTISVDTAPSFTERASWYWRTTLAPSIPFLSVLVPSGQLILSGLPFIVFWRRRQLDGGEDDA